MFIKISLLTASSVLLSAFVTSDVKGGNRLPAPAVRPAAVASEVVLQGHLQLYWSDSLPGSKTGSRLTVTLIDDAERRYLLDTKQALRAAGDLYALKGRRVAMTLVKQSASTAKIGVDANAGMMPEVIVPIDEPALKSSKPATQQMAAGMLTTTAVTGTKRWVTLLCKFSDVAAVPQPTSFFQSMYTNTRGSLDHYFRQVSNNNINLAGSTAHGWFTLPDRLGYYTNIDWRPALFKDCTAKADASVNFADVYGINLVFNGDYADHAGALTMSATLDGVTKNWPITYLPLGASTGLPYYAHEMGHAFGLPHTNNSDGDGDTYDSPWDVMSNPVINSYTYAPYGTLPKHLSMYSKNALGWVSAGKTYTFLRTSSSNTGIIGDLDRANYPGVPPNFQMFVLEVPNQPNRYYIVEVRLRKGVYDGALPGNAVIIHSVDTTRQEPAWSVDADNPPATVSNDEGSMFKVGESWTSPGPVGSRYRVTVNAAIAEGFRVTVELI